MSARYAIYFAPAAAHPLWQAGCDWLGRDAESGARTDRKADMLVAGLDALTTAPRRYGFHATIKAPFRLTPGMNAQDLAVALARYAGAQRAFAVPLLEVARLGDFIALIPRSPEPEISRIEHEVVTQFDAFRAAMTEAEMEQRRASGLDPVQEKLLQRWGYPFVMERFRFHLSLTGSLADADPQLFTRVTDAARAHFHAALSGGLFFDALCIFEEPARGADFRLIRRLPLAASSAN